MKVLVTGGGGFLGGAIVRRLAARGDDVRTLQRGEYPELRRLGAEVHRGDLADAETVHRAVRGCDLAFHVAAKAGVWGPYAEYHRANVVGTANVVQACRRQGVGRLVFTSSPSVVFDGTDEDGIDESAPYARRYLAHYPRTKAMAERFVLAANGDGLATVALRPHLIWGPGDPHLAPRIVERARAGRLRIVGDGRNLVDSTYIDNAAAAHLAAGDRLMSGDAALRTACAGKAYFISNGEPMAMGELIDRILDAAGLARATRHVSPRAAYAVGCVLECAYRLGRIRGEPAMTRFVARQLATAHWFDISAARRDLGYVPEVSIDEGMRRLSASLLGTAP
jgi:nucleoside-diphosphate-sugar epimerase